MRAAKDLPWWALGLSLIATSFSAASILGGPGEGYSHGFLYLQLQLGDLIGYSLVILVLLPFFVKLDIISAYEYLEKRFDNKNRALGSLFFLLFVIARLGGLLYAASLVFATVSGNAPIFSNYSGGYCLDYLYCHRRDGGCCLD